jgi:hypothetical protein
MGLSGERPFTNDHRGLHRATWSARQARRLRWGLRVTRRGPPGAARVLGADATGERRRGRPITATGCACEAGRSPTTHVIRGVGVTWGAMRRLSPVPGARRVWAWPWLPARGPPAEQAKRRRHTTRVDGGRPRRPHVRRWRPGRRLVLVVEGGCAAVSLALACVPPQGAMVSRVRGEAARAQRPGPQPPGTRGPTPLQGKRQRRWHAWTARADTPWATVAVDGYGGRRQHLWGFAHTALWQTRGWPPVDLRCVWVGDPEGKRRMDAFCCPDRQATPEPLLAGVVRRWSGDVTCEEGRAQRGLATQRPWSDQASARITPVLLALCSLVTLRA